MRSIPLRINNVKNLTVIITGCGFKPIRHIYRYNGKPSHDIIPINGKSHKMNIGTASAYYLSKRGIPVIMVSRTPESLKKIKNGLVQLGCKKELISYVAADMMTDFGIKKLIRQLPKGKIFYWLQSIGLSGGAYKIPHDNIYLPFEKIYPDIIKAELEIVIATHRMMLQIIHVFRRQVKHKQKAKIAIITSMSGERGYHFGATHVAAKHALVGYIRGVEKELKDEGIEVFDIRAGGIDTGMYDNLYTRQAVEEISRRTKMWGGKKPIYAHPLQVAEKIYQAFFSRSPQKVYRILAPHQS